MPHSEFKALYLTGIQKNPSSASSVDPAQHASGLPWSLRLSTNDLPSKWNWYDRGIVTPVKDQKHCGGCWAFSAVETLESAFALQWNITNPAPLSVQEVVDCATNNYGCNGGNVAPAYDWLIETGMPLVVESRYPVTDKPEYCTYFTQPVAGVFLTNYSCYRFVGAEDLLRQHLYHFGPVAAVVDATTWNDYLGGIIQWHCTDNINHYIQLVGYDMTGPVPYYIARNSWGSDWGNNGYLYIKTDGNVCGVAETVCEVLGTKPSG